MAVSPISQSWRGTPVRDVTTQVHAKFRPANVLSLHFEFHVLGFNGKGPRAHSIWLQLHHHGQADEPLENKIYFLETPKFVRFLPSLLSVSLSSPDFFMTFLIPVPDLLPEVADVGVALFDASCFMKEVLIGVGTCDGVV